MAPEADSVPDMSSVWMGWLWIWYLEAQILSDISQFLVPAMSGRKLIFWSPTAQVFVQV